MKVLLVEDSKAVRAYLETLLSAEPDLQLLPSAADGRDGVRKAFELAPDVILMDLELPVLDGVGAIREIMARRPRPIVVLSAFIDNPATDRTFESLEAGAVDVLAKPAGLLPEKIEEFKSRLLGTLRLMAKARVVRRHPAPEQRLSHSPAPVGDRECGAIGIGSSTGGPPVIQQLLLDLPRPCPLPVFISQHIVPGFEPGLVQWLRDTTGHSVKLAGHQQPVEPETIFVAPADRHMEVRDRRIRLVDPGPDLYIPSVNALFYSMAEEYERRCVAVLLSGMGEDGALGLRRLSDAGAVTAVQSAESCVVNGMPDAARRLARPGFDLPPGELGGLLRAMVSGRAGAPAADAAGAAAT